LIKEALIYWFEQHTIEKLMDWECFPYVQQEKAKLMKAYYLSDHLLRRKSKPHWQDLVGVMKSLVKSQSGYELYLCANLCASLGSPVVDSFIEHNIVHLHPVLL